ncbi:exodeoxyribonuclease VII small subunit [Ferruginibacter sp. HRS2-29]|uniref:exodeoxyribonuclease VII small subunit n=1 Tax=Ferruginibacter sp. HRS2-29 TaxID=2487334 RepID=UPI0020CCE260|nr:exodeoxyribonuclease VII small subunit [Ferruginibacter sp. HRS2-29]MCP9751229.1 exodeoxyribonuclease VII small subunit [Ferruginibacter sp. HRS2-29]
MSETLNYANAMAELSAIAEAMEDESIGIDELSEKVKRAAELIAFCQDKLRSTEEDVRKVIAKMDGKNKK